MAIEVAAHRRLECLIRRRRNIDGGASRRLGDHPERPLQRLADRFDDRSLAPARRLLRVEEGEAPLREPTSSASAVAVVVDSWNESRIARARDEAVEFSCIHAVVDEQPARHAVFLGFFVPTPTNNSIVMNPLLRDLCRHQAWADAEHWRVIEQHPPAAADPAIRSRLHHIHQVQRAFVWAVGSGETMPKMTKVEDFGSLDELKAYARDSHGQFTGVLETVTATRLDERIAIPWFQNPALISR